MGTDFDLYVPRDTLFHRLDPRVKLLFVAEVTLFALLWPGIRMALAIILLSSLLMWAARIPAQRIASVWRTMAILCIMVFLLTALFGGPGGRPCVQFGPLAVTAASLEAGLALALRLMALALAFALWLFTTDQASIVRGFVGLRMPYEWGLTLGLAFRFLPTFAALFDQVREAQQARGLELAQATFGRRLQAYRPILIAMVICALRNSERLGWALESRALGAPGVRRSQLKSLHLREVDWLAMMVLVVGLAGGIVARATVY